jgi:uncharacterized protein (TIGR00290 family)
MQEKAIMTWSGGKDSALALKEIRDHYNYEIVALLTTVTTGYDRISMHGVPRVLLEQQVEALGYRLEMVFLNKRSSNEEYEEKMKEVLLKYKSQGVRQVIFGDIFLEDVRQYREDNLARIDMNGIFPLWRMRTDRLVKRFVDDGFKAIVTCVDTEQLDGSFAGREIDTQFLADLPGEVDPCGENGEYHSFVYDGPMFKKTVEFERGEVVLRDKQFMYFDLIPLEINGK